MIELTSPLMPGLATGVRPAGIFPGMTSDFALALAQVFAAPAIEAGGVAPAIPPGPGLPAAAPQRQDIAAPGNALPPVTDPLETIAAPLEEATPLPFVAQAAPDTGERPVTAPARKPRHAGRSPATTLPQQPAAPELPEAAPPATRSARARPAEKAEQPAAQIATNPLPQPPQPVIAIEVVSVAESLAPAAPVPAQPDNTPAPITPTKRTAAQPRTPIAAAPAGSETQSVADTLPPVSGKTAAAPIALPDSAAPETPQPAMRPATTRPAPLAAPDPLPSPAGASNTVAPKQTAPAAPVEAALPPSTAPQPERVANHRASPAPVAGVPVERAMLAETQAAPVPADATTDAAAAVAMAVVAPSIGAARPAARHADDTITIAPPPSMPAMEQAQSSATAAAVTTAAPAASGSPPPSPAAQANPVPAERSAAPATPVAPLSAAPLPVAEAAPAVPAPSAPPADVLPSADKATPAITATPMPEPKAKDAARPATEVTGPTIARRAPTPAPQPQPAAQVFAAALFAADLAPPAGRGRFAEPAAPLSVEAVMATAAPAAPHPVVHAVADARQAPLDLSRHEWMTSMIDRIETLRDDGGVRETRIRLAPDALGSIDLAIRHDERGELKVHINAETAQARALLAEAAPRLADMAEARGLKLGGAFVDAGTAQGDTARHGDARPDPQQPARPASAFAANDDAAGATIDSRIA